MLPILDLYAFEFPTASHTVPGSLPKSFPSGAKPHILPIPGSYPRPIQAPKPSHPVLDGKRLGLVWEECFVIVQPVP